MRAFRLGAVALAIAALAGFAVEGTRGPALIERGRAVYNFRCYFCHGYSGDARTLAATYLTPKPRDFTAAGPTLDAAAIERAVREGRAGTAMKSFAGILDADDVRAVAAFVEQTFVQRRERNTAYHTEANGWARHERHADAAPFATGALALDTPVEALPDAARQGRALFLTSCVSCHDRARVASDGPAWETRPVSYPRLGFVPGQSLAPPLDAVTAASPYAKHDVPPHVDGLDARQRRGKALFEANCAFCHGADGTGRNWIGQFMEPHARDLTQYTPKSMPPLLLRRRIREGLPGTSMPAWQQVLQPAEVEAVSAYVARAFFRPD